jgi:glycosyltransferase involved in cell wall biosynthesis
MFISVVIPLFNKKDYILRTISSVLAQTHSDFELIIVDDGSTDGGTDIAQSISDARIKIISQKNGGVSKARNTGVLNANYEWVAFLDADDEYEPDFLEQIINFLSEYKNSNLSMIGTNYYIKNDIITVADTTIKSGVYNYFELFTLLRRSPNNSSTTVVRKKNFCEVEGFPDGVKHFEDWIAWFKLAVTGNFGYIANPLGVYHYVKGSAAGSGTLESLFYDAELVPKTIAEYAVKYSLSGDLKKTAWNCINEFSIDIAGFLVVRGKKSLALKMMRFIRIKYISLKQIRRFKGLLFNLVVPREFKEFCFKSKWSLCQKKNRQ